MIALIWIAIQLKEPHATGCRSEWTKVKFFKLLGAAFTAERIVA